MICKFPMKPVRVDDNVFDRLDMSNYYLESKYDGFRCLFVLGKTVKLFTREMRPMDIPECISRDLGRVDLPEDTILDGEIWNHSKRGSWRHDRNSICQLTFWDIVKYGGHDYCNEPLEKRREALRKHLPYSSAMSMVEVYEPTKENYSKIKEEAFRVRDSHNSKSGYVHGVVLKKKNSPRRDHPTKTLEHPDWLKICWF